MTSDHPSGAPGDGSNVDSYASPHSPALDYVQEIVVEEAPGLRTLIIGRNIEEPPGGAMRFWLGIAMVSLAIGLVDAFGARPWLPVSWVVWLVALFAAGLAAMHRLKQTETVHVSTLALVDRTEGEVRLPDRAGRSPSLDGRRLPFEEIVEVIYALRDVPIPGRGRNPELLGATVHLRDVSGTAWPVVPATHAREAAFRAASVLALRIGVGVKQVGSGWRT